MAQAGRYREAWRYIREAGPMPGGMMQFGIPAYRLPRADLMREIQRIETTGVKIVLNHKVEDILAEISAGEFNAAFIAIGADVGKHIEIPARDAMRVLDAVSLLRILQGFKSNRQTHNH